MTVPVEGFHRILPTYSTRFDRRGDALLLTIGLLIGLIGIVPALALGVKWLGLQIPLPALIGVAIILAVYVVVVIMMRRIALGSLVALVVLSTFAANLPLMKATSYPGELGPQLWLFHIPLLALVVLYAVRGEYSLSSFTTVEYAFGAFVLWSVISAFVNAPRPDTALYFSLFMLFVWLALSVASRSIRTGVLDLRTFLSVFILTACGQATFAFMEFIHQGPFGLTYLGETFRPGGADAIFLGPLGEYHIGVFIGGFTGSAGPLSVVLVLAAPIALAFAFDARGSQRVGPLLATALMVVIVRLSGKDSARAALLIGLVIVPFLWIWTRRDVLADGGLERVFVRICGAIFPIVVATGTLLYPSKSSGQSSQFPPASQSNPSSDSAPKDVGGGGGGGGGGGDIAVDISSLSIPYLSLNSLGIRLRQYLAGIEMFLRHPIFGIGGANYLYISPQYGFPSHHGIGKYPLHNQYIAVLAETGLLGFLAYAIALVAVLRDGVRWVTAHTRDSVVPIGLFAGIIGYLAVAFWVVNIRVVMVVPFWLVAGALVGEQLRT
jgi:hypothetical protein